MPNNHGLLILTIHVYQFAVDVNITGIYFRIPTYTHVFDPGKNNKNIKKKTMVIK